MQILTPTIPYGMPGNTQMQGKKRMGEKGNSKIEINSKALSNITDFTTCRQTIKSLQQATVWVMKYMVKVK